MPTRSSRRGEFSNRFLSITFSLCSFCYVLFAYFACSVPSRQLKSRVQVSWGALLSKSLNSSTGSKSFSLHFMRCDISWNVNFSKVLSRSSRLLWRCAVFAMKLQISRLSDFLHRGICIDHNEAKLGWMVVPPYRRYSQYSQGIVFVGFDCATTFRRCWLICLTDILHFLVSIRKVSRRSCIPSEAGN